MGDLRTARTWMTTAVCGIALIGGLPLAGAAGIDCAALARGSAGLEPDGYAEQCLGGVVSQSTEGGTGRAPSDVAFAHDIGFVSDNLVSFVLNDFPGQTVLSTNTDTIFGYDFNIGTSILWALENTGQQFGTMDWATGVFMAIGPAVPVGADTWSGLAVDPMTDVIYASSTDGAASSLYTIDPVSGAPTLIGPMGINLAIDIAINAEGTIYTHDIGTDEIFTVDAATGMAYLVGPTGFDASFAQGMDFDNQDGTLYMFLYQGGGANVFGTANLHTGAVTALATDNPLGEFEGATGTFAPPGGKVFAGTSVNAVGGSSNPNLVNILTDAATSVIPSMPVWGATYDAARGRVLFTSDGAVGGEALWAWKDGASPVYLGDITESGTPFRIDGLAFSGGVLYGSRAAGAVDGLYEINLATLAATLVFGYTDSISGIDADPETGTIYGVNDSTGFLVEIDPIGQTVTPVVAYPDPAETDIDGLGVGGGKAFLIPDDNDPGLIYVYDFGAGAYEAPLTAPWIAFSDTFSGGAFIRGGVQPVSLFADGFASGDVVVWSNSTP